MRVYTTLLTISLILSSSEVGGIVCETLFKLSTRYAPDGIELSSHNIFKFRLMYALFDTSIMYDVYTLMLT